MSFQVGGLEIYRLDELRVAIILLIIKDKTVFFFTFASMPRRILRKSGGQTKASSCAKDREVKSERKGNLAFLGAKNSEQKPLRDYYLSRKRLSLMADRLEGREISGNTEIF